MKLSELVNSISELSPRILDYDLAIQIEKPYTTIGPTPIVPVKNFHVGFDWDNGKLLIIPENPLIEKDIDFVKQFKDLQDKAGWLEYENRNLKSQIKKLRKAND